MEITVKEFLEKGIEVLKTFRTYLPPEDIYDIVVRRIVERKLPLDSKITILQCTGYKYLESADETINGLHVKVCEDKEGKIYYFPTDGISDVIADDEILFEESAETEDNTYYEDTIIIISEFDNPYYFNEEELEEFDRSRIKEFEEDFEDAINEDRVYIEYIYDTESNICPTMLLIFSDEKKFKEYVTLNYLMNWKDASERVKKLALSRPIVYI